LFGFGDLVWPGGVLPAGFVGVAVAGDVLGLGADDADGDGDGCRSADGDGCGSAVGDADRVGAGAPADGPEDPAWPSPVCPAAAGCWPGWAPAGRGSAHEMIGALGPPASPTVIRTSAAAMTTPAPMPSKRTVLRRRPD
jgi:hypothetical protein